MHQSPKPLAVLTPDIIEGPFSLDKIEELLISTLIVQTGNNSTEISRSRWRKHFGRWKRQATPELPRLVVFIDGLNQRESVQWKKFIDPMSLLLSELGAKLVLSFRTPFFDSNLRRPLVDKVEVQRV